MKKSFDYFVRRTWFDLWAGIAEGKQNITTDIEDKKALDRTLELMEIVEKTIPGEK